MTRVVRDERGVALPMAMFALLMLLSLSLAFLTLGQSEPVISGNHMRSAQARVLAEAGVERALWALSNTASSGVADPYPTGVFSAPAGYDGLTFHTLSTATGGFTVKLTGVDQYTVTVETEGWMPTVGRATVTGYSASDLRTKAHRKVQVTAIRYPNFAFNAVCALCVKGDLVVKGSSVINSTADTSCGNKYGVSTTGTLCLGGDSACDVSDPQWGNTGSINGATGATAADNEPGDYQSGVAASTFDGMTLSTSQLDALRVMAKDQGTHYTGATTFNSSNKVPGGKSIVFVDGDVSMSGNPYTGDAFTGWLIVVGSASVNGNGTINGLLYATNDITSSSGTNVINGLVVSQNASNTTTIDSSAGGNMTVNFNCSYANGNNQIPIKWFPKPGSWTEPSG